MRILVTGSAGFIGFHVARALLGQGHVVTGIDNLNAYYQPELKRARVDILSGAANFHEARIDLKDAEALRGLFDKFQPRRVIHLAAQPGVRYSLENPRAYTDNNVSGFLNVLDECQRYEVEHLVFASSSSVYGANLAMPFRETDGVSHPLSLYAATKLADEAMAHAYAHAFGLPCTGLRFFTVYGPWGRPDMALFKFTRAILSGKPVDIYNHGDLSRDFTYIDDVVEGVVRIADKRPVRDDDWNARARQPAPDRSGVAPFALYNIGNGTPVRLGHFIEILERKLQKSARVNDLPMQVGDVYETWADCSRLWEAIGYKPATGIEDGVSRFVDWYRSFYEV